MEKKKKFIDMDTVGGSRSENKMGIEYLLRRWSFGEDQTDKKEPGMLRPRDAHSGRININYKDSKIWTRMMNSRKRKKFSRLKIWSEDVRQEISLWNKEQISLNLVGPGEECGFYSKCKTKALEHLQQRDDLTCSKRIFFTLCVEQIEEEKWRSQLLLEA